MNIRTPAFRLLCACCRWPSSEAKKAAIAEAAAAGVDWDRFRALTDFHRVCGLVRATLAITALTPPPEFQDWLVGKVQMIARANLLQLHETIRLQRLFSSAGIDALSLKGVALGQHVYGTVAIKQNRDIDFVVPPKDILNALALAQSDGYRLFEPSDKLSHGQIAAFARYGKEFALQKSGVLLLEIHSRLTDNPTLLDDRRLDRNGQEITFGPTQHVRTLTDEDLFAYLCAHGSRHGWSRLKWLADLNALLERAGGEEGVQRFNARADLLGAKWCAVQAHSLCHELLGRTLPESLQALASTRRAQRLKRHCYDTMSLPARGTAPNPMRDLRDAIMQSQLGSGWRFWRGFAQTQGVGTTIILELNLAERRISLYPYIRPFFWLWFRWLSPRGRYRRNRNSVDTTT